MRNCFVIFLILSLVFHSTAYAIQIKSTTDNEKIDAVVSANELSRIFVSGDRIQSTRGLNGAYELLKDEQQGSIFIKPTPFYIQRGFNVFITTESGHTYNLFLTPKNTPAETIELKPLSPSHSIATRWETNSPYVEKVTELINVMVNEKKPEGYAVIHLGKVKSKQLTNGLTMQLIALYRGGHLQGEIWRIKNTCRKTLHLKPRDFFENHVRAISLTDEKLHLGSETRLYRVISHG